MGDNSSVVSLGRKSSLSIESYCKTQQIESQTEDPDDEGLQICKQNSGDSEIARHPENKSGVLHGNLKLQDESPKQGKKSRERQRGKGSPGCYFYHTTRMYCILNRLVWNDMAVRCSEKMTNFLRMFKMPNKKKITKNEKMKIKLLLSVVIDDFQPGSAAVTDLCTKALEDIGQNRKAYGSDFKNPSLRKLKKWFLNYRNFAVKAYKSLSLQ